jgi:hypothetical protein
MTFCETESAGSRICSPAQKNANLEEPKMFDGLAGEFAGRAVEYVQAPQSDERVRPKKPPVVYELRSRGLFWSSVRDVDRTACSLQAASPVVAWEHERWPISGLV